MQKFVKAKSNLDKIENLKGIKELLRQIEEIEQQVLSAPRTKNASWMRK